MTRAIDLAGFESKFATADDPWGCRSARPEALKRARALSGLGLVAATLDVACGDGAATGVLARRALRTDACDGACSALASARRMLGGDRLRVRFHHCQIPRELPRARWQRVHVSELVYYLRRHEILALADALADRLAPGGELISVHHVVPFDDAATRPALAVALFHRRLGRRLRLRRLSRHGRYVVARLLAA